MAYYLVRGKPIPEKMDELRKKVSQQAFKDLRPFGTAITHSLEGARWDPETGEAIWEEEDYCSPPLAMERAAVLDRYFTSLTVEKVEMGKGWEKIAWLGSFWEQGAEE